MAVSFDGYTRNQLSARSFPRPEKSRTVLQSAGCAPFGELGFHLYCVVGCVADQPLRSKALLWHASVIVAFAGITERISHDAVATRRISKDFSSGFCSSENPDRSIFEDWTLDAAAIHIAKKKIPKYLGSDKGKITRRAKA